MNPSATALLRPRRLADLSETRLVQLVLLHMPLAVALQRVPFTSTGHALAVSVLGLLFASRDREPARVLATIAYIGGCDVLWRGTRALVFWEFAKYASVGLAILVLVRWGDRRRRSDLLGLAYALALLPSLLALPYFDRQEVAFNLSGPVALGVCAFALSTAAVTPGQGRTILAAALGPCVGLGFLAAISTLQVRDFSEVVVGGKATTAGLGPNQVSAILGLGAVLSFLLLVLTKRRLSRVCFGAVSLWLLAQAMLSLSRGGFWAAIGAIAVGAIAILRDRKQRRTALVAAALLVPLFQLAIFPAVDALTGGLVGSRFRDDDLTGRDKIVEADWLMFRENPLLGVGPGQSMYGHEATFRVAAAHVEYSRLLAEHGSFGVLALVLLFAMGVRRFRAARHPLQRSLVLSLGIWTALTMGHSAMRFVAPATMLALAGVGWVLPGDPAPSPTARRRRRQPLAAPSFPRRSRNERD